jgi:hypothetical protein
VFPDLPWSATRMLSSGSETSLHPVETSKTFQNGSGTPVSFRRVVPGAAKYGASTTKSERPDLDHSSSRSRSDQETPRIFFCRRTSQNASGRPVPVRLVRLPTLRGSAFWGQI